MESSINTDGGKDVLLILIVLLFIHANYAAYGNSRQLETLPELEMSEEMVNTTAASLRVKINNVLLMAQDMTLGNDFWLFFKVLFVYGSFLPLVAIAHSSHLPMLVRKFIYLLIAHSSFL
ncbi:hypothetical protein J1N35_029682 [Gossypium stocksii]|uniref:Reticulon domain-containing protein n=1 Tax=Gossypium stocksii TaxID=47602 RepID=A0A9D3UY18_9ROSI|nr:hypothetical protein J1N35_029682 [Gossypium stocksii]